MTQHTAAKRRYRKYTPVYEFVKANPPLSPRELAAKFDIAADAARQILHACEKFTPEKTTAEYAAELDAAMSAADFAALHNCTISTAYGALAKAGKLKPPSKTERTPRQQPDALAPRLPAPKPKTTPDTRLIASIYQAWAEKNL